MTQERINKARTLAGAHPGKASRIILALCDEIEKLRRLTLRKGLHPVGADEPWPYHPHLSTPFAEIPEEYLVAWMNRQNRDGLLHDVSCGIIAARDLKLYEYIRKLATPIKNKNGQVPDPETVEIGYIIKPRWKDVPFDAVDLAMDIARLEQILVLLKGLNSIHIGNTWTQRQRDSNSRFVRTTTAVIRGWQRTAQDKLRTQYLAP